MVMEVETRSEQTLGEQYSIPEVTRRFPNRILASVVRARTAEPYPRSFHDPSTMDPE